MVREKEIQEFIDILKNTVEYVPETKIHWLGIWILTNDDMRKMCSKKFGYLYNILTGREQRELRERIFKALEGENNGKE